MKKLMLVVVVLLMLCGCQNKEEIQNEEIKEDVPQTAEEAEVSAVKEISDEEIYEMYLKNQSFVEKNFYMGTPEWELGADWNRLDTENGATPATVCHSVREFKEYMKNNYELSEAFIDKLIDSVSSFMYEKEGELWIVSAGRGGDITVGLETGHEVLRQGDKIVLRISHEQLEVETETVKGTFDTDNTLIYEDGKWVFEDIPAFR